MSRAPLPGLLAAAAAGLLSLVAGGCGGGSTPHPPASGGSAAATAPVSTTTAATPTTSAPAPVPVAGAVHITFMVPTASSTPCPPHSPAKDECFLLSGAAEGTPYGVVRLGPELDPEASALGADCGARTTYSTRWSTSQGTLRMTETGPKLCVGASGTFHRTFAVSGGTGHYAGARGAGTVLVTIRGEGATEAWAGTITP